MLWKTEGNFILYFKSGICIRSTRLTNKVTWTAICFISISDCDIMHVGSISTAFSSLFSVPPREESSREERGLLSRTAAGNRAYYARCSYVLRYWAFDIVNLTELLEFQTGEIKKIFHYTVQRSCSIFLLSYRPDKWNYYDEDKCTKMAGCMEMVLKLFRSNGKDSATVNDKLYTLCVYLHKKMCMLYITDTVYQRNQINHISLTGLNNYYRISYNTYWKVPIEPSQSPPPSENQLTLICSLSAVGSIFP